MTAEDKPVVYGMRAVILRSWTNAGPNPSHVICGDPEAREVYVVGDGIPRSYPVYRDTPMVVLGETAPGYVVARPASRCPRDRNGYMASGAYIVQSGCYEDWISVFGHPLPIPLHDRAERRAW
ncbi:hypothetical protein AB5J62_33805 [Amycolatopsis sp. cg5]|uniref:hypothetical protein n=1 Tax=Amycolatopsis sp. cg5 TaxID=3238802 RepID=UPI003525526A